MTTTTRAQRLVESGEVHWVDLDPVLDSEQGGRRPVLILSDGSLHRISGRALVCPITSNRHPWPTKVIIPSGCVISGALLTDQVRMLDRQRGFRYIGRLPDDLVLRVKHRVAAYMGVAPAIDTEMP